MKTEETIVNFENDAAPPLIFEDINNISNDFNLIKEESSHSLHNKSINNIDENNFNLFSLDSNDTVSEKCILKLNLSPFLLNQLDKKYLIYLIQYIDTFCDLTIENKNLHKIENNIFTIKNVSKKNFNKYSLYVPLKKFINYKNDKNNDNNENKEQQKKEYFCEYHNKKLFNYNDYMYLPKFQCDKNNHFINENNYINNNNNNNINLNDNNDLDNFVNKQKLKAKLNYNKNEMIKCQECDLIFNNKGLMKLHMNQFHKKINKEESKSNNSFKADNFIKNEINNKIIERNNIKENINNNYICKKDGKIFEIEEDYIKHFQKYHPYDYPFYCKDCNKGFFNNKLLKKHLKKIKH
jgi:uncharacterized C2H2 Zn-finger protein